MGDKKVNFLGKEYVISDQLPILVPILQSFDEYKDILMKKLLDQINKNNYSGGADEDFIYWSEPISAIAKAIIKSAAQVGVYDLTEYDIVENNPGYRRLRQVCTETMRQMTLALTEAMIDYMEGYDNAYADAASNITGSGVSIWTNSLGSALLYSAMEGNVLRKQAKQADKQFNEALRDLNTRNQSKQKEKEARAKTHIYYPGCKESIEITISYMLDTYLKRLDENNVINCSEIARYDMKASLEIMKNLDVIPQKAEVLGKAFEKCPYNSNIYATAVDLSLFDDDSIDTVKYLKIDNDFKSYVEEKVGSVSSVHDIKSFIAKKYYTHLSALMMGVDDVNYRKNKTSKVYDSVVAEYTNYSKMIDNEQLCSNFSSEIKEGEDIEGFVSNKIHEIVSDDAFELLIDECGHTTLISDITPTGYTGIKSKKTIDSYYIKTISEKCIPLINERLKKQKEEKIRIDEEKRKERERLEELEKKRNKRNKTIALIVGSSIIITTAILTVVFVVIPKMKYNKAKSFMDAHSYLEAIEQFENLDSQKYSSQIDECRKLYINQLKEDGKYDAAKEYLVSVVGLTNTSDDVKDCDYLKALKLFDEAKYDEAIELFQNLNDYKDSQEKVMASNYEKAIILKESGDYVLAKDAFSALGKYKDSKELCDEMQHFIDYNDALSKIESGAYADAVDIMNDLGDFQDSDKYVSNYKEKGCEELYNKGMYEKCISYCRKYSISNDYYIESLYNYGMSVYNNGSVESAASYLKECVEQHPDVNSIIAEAETIKKYNQAVSNMNSGNIDYAYELFSEIPSSFKNTNSLRSKCAKYAGMAGKWKCVAWEQADGTMVTDRHMSDHDITVSVSISEDSESISVHWGNTGETFRMGGKTRYGYDVNMTVSGGVIRWEGGTADWYTFNTNTGVANYYLYRTYTNKYEKQ